MRVSTVLTKASALNFEQNYRSSDQIINLIDVKKDPHITLSQDNITPFDISVMDAIYTIICMGYTIIAAEWIAKVMSGNIKQKATKKQLASIYDSIDKMRCVHIKISGKNDTVSGGNTKNKIREFSCESYLLPVDKITTIYENGKQTVAYPVLAKPALYRYAEAIHQIIEVPVNFLDTQAEYRDTEEAILIKRYIVKHIGQVFGKEKVSYLSYEEENDAQKGLFPELGYYPDNTGKWRNKKEKINKVVKLTLESLKKKHIIVDYESYRKNETKNPAVPIMGYKIHY